MIATEKLRSINKYTYTDYGLRLLLPQFSNPSWLKICTRISKAYSSSLHGFLWKIIKVFFNSVLLPPALLPLALWFIHKCKRESDTAAAGTVVFVCRPQCQYNYSLESQAQTTFLIMKITSRSVICTRDNNCSYIWETITRTRFSLKK